MESHDDEQEEEEQAFIEAEAVFLMLDHLANQWTQRNFPVGTAYYPTWSDVLIESLRRLSCRNSRPVPHRPPRTYLWQQRLSELEARLKIAIAIVIFLLLILLLYQV